MSDKLTEETKAASISEGDRAAADSLNNNYRHVTENRYDIGDYESEEETSQGLAATHEQFSDAYVVAGDNNPAPESQPSAQRD